MKCWKRKLRWGLILVNCCCLWMFRLLNVLHNCHSSEEESVCWWFHLVSGELCIELFHGQRSAGECEKVYELLGMGNVALQREVSPRAIKSPGSAVNRFQTFIPMFVGSQACTDSVLLVDVICSTHAQYSRQYKALRISLWYFGASLCISARGGYLVW